MKRPAVVVVAVLILSLTVWLVFHYLGLDLTRNDTFVVAEPQGERPRTACDSSFDRGEGDEHGASTADRLSAQEWSPGSRAVDLSFPYVAYGPSHRPSATPVPPSTCRLSPHRSTARDL